MKFVRENLFGASLIIVLAVGLLVAASNQKIFDGKVEGKVTRLGATKDKYSLGTEVWLELKDGRTARVVFPASALIPVIGQAIEVSHYRGLLFGDDFSYP